MRQGQDQQIAFRPLIGREGAGFNRHKIIVLSPHKRNTPTLTLTQSRALLGIRRDMSCCERAQMSWDDNN